MKIAYLECSSGISGDMFLGALVDAGVSRDVLREAVESLNLGASLSFRTVDRSGISATKVDVLVDGELAEVPGDLPDAVDTNFAHQHSHPHTHPHSHPHTHGPGGDSAHATTDDHSDNHSHSHEHDHDDEHEHDHHHDHQHRSLTVILGLIASAKLTPATKALAIRAFETLGAAEAKIHNVALDEIHFHEVGAIDAIVDIVATCAGVESLGVDRWICSPLNVGSGRVQCAHGDFPVPAPATLEILKGAPIYASGPSKELVTPTGAALLRALDVSFEQFPSMTLQSIGYGAGSRNFPHFPNVLRLSVGAPQVAFKPAQDADFTMHPAETTGVIETTIDDLNPQILAYVAELLLANGAADVVRTPVQMKKGRNGIHLTVLCSPDRRAHLSELLFRETTTIGLRYHEEQKYCLPRRWISVSTRWGPVRIKLAELSDGSLSNAAPEYEDCRAIAQRYAVPLKEVLQEATRVYLAGASSNLASSETSLPSPSETSVPITRNGID